MSCTFKVADIPFHSLNRRRRNVDGRRAYNGLVRDSEHHHVSIVIFCELAWARSLTYCSSAAGIVATGRVRVVVA